MPRQLKKRVFPGEELADIEEYSDGDGSYQLDGLVRSEEIGEVRLDGQRRALDVRKATRSLNIPREGDTVIAEAGSVTRRDARVDIIRLKGKPCEPTYTGVIHQYDVAREFSRNLESAMLNGDVIKARIANTKNTIIQLAMDTPELGVVYAYCSSCGQLLELQRGQLVCSSCKRVERRQTARSYGKEDLT